jgi:hypothetical protein
MALFSRPRRGRSQLGDLSSWAELRSGLEAFLEPATGQSPTTLLLVADDGEFIRRPVLSVQEAQKFARRLGIPVYDVHRVGYPKRMREYAQRKSGRSARSASAGTSGSGPGPRETPASAPRPRFNPAAVKVLALHAGVAPPESPSIEDLRRLHRAARARVHPDRADGQRSAWDVVEAAARELGL